MKLEVNNLSFKYLNSRVIFEQVNFELEKGQILSILGPNGAGKSTLLNCIGNLITPQKGKIRLNGEDVDKMPPKKVAQRIGYVPQIHVPTYEYTVREFVVMGRTPYLGKTRSPGDTDYEQVERALDMVGITHLIEKPYTQISGGERQLVTIARAIVQEPDFILLDEPTAHLDFGNQIKTMRLVKKLSENGFGIIMTTHNPDQVFYTGGFVALLDRQGRLHCGEPEHILTEPSLTQLYQERVCVFYSDELKRRVCISGI
ncbi:ABC transporter ATP-binding protein [Eubacterium sp. 1001713B170207_170306_E7]|uniref:ABC transporter ATP-binding protein n=1 Tax=Eubacterium sp. 1001713B170207_170306_E7 TaxID=2787097 RepID=UPI0018979C10|nr:ABC transporter ATP-binding protein [Eubacterium sp. 1001713B170207_170306_E7]